MKLVLSLLVFGSFCYHGDLWLVSTNSYANTYEVMLVETRSIECMRDTI